MVFLGNLTHWRKRTQRTILLLIWLCGFWPCSYLEAQANEYELKASFLYNFTQFVQWPETAFSAPDSPFQLCLIGEDPFGRTLDDTVTSEFVDKHPIVVRRIRDVDNTTACHLAFISAKSDIPFEAVLQTVRDSPVLLVGEDPESAEKGGTIAFRIIDSRIRLAVNLSAARTANLKISSKLLKLSTIVAH